MYLAVDIGGTKTLLACSDEGGEIQQQIKFPTSQNYQDFLKTLAENVANLSTKDFVMAAVAVPGRLDRMRGVSLAFGNLPWHEVPVQGDIQEVLGCPVHIENDANLAGLSEAAHIKDRYRKVLYITISTGIGGGYIIDGKIDPDTVDAEVGHMLFEHEGQLMIWEKFASGKAIVEAYGMRASEIKDSAIWQKISRNLALGIINVSAVLTPDVIVLGGGVGSHYDKFGQALDQILKEISPGMVSIPPILPAKRPEEAVIYGCYELIRSLDEAPAA